MKESGMGKNKIQLEVCADSQEGALIAQSMGACRVELCANVAEGGVTPSPAQISITRKKLSIKLYVLIRPRGGDFLYDDTEFETMKSDIHYCGQTGCDGVTIGMLCPDGTIDKERNRELINIAHQYSMGVTFHRAFDRSRDLFRSLEDIIELGCERILTSGGCNTAIEGADTIRRLIAQADNRIAIMAGAGITPENAEDLITKTVLKEIHGTFQSRFHSKMQYHNEKLLHQENEYALRKTDSEKIKKIMKILLFPLIFSALFLCACNSYQQQVHKQFEKRKTEMVNSNKDLFSIFEKNDLTSEQREALEFLYAYMPLSDLADYDGEFFLNQVNTAFEARDYFSWGQTVPDDIFRHFVLVYRVNNENLDNARQIFFEELKERIKNLSMYEAALEVNHWCHEKVTYKGTDARTSSPLALVRTSWGRCGEESTFTTTALRAVSIPARQCYTPRWVHTDDNHAWVEVWIDGKWHYLGACEPEPELDVAWFTGAASRAMMVHSTVFGLYTGQEEKNLEKPLYSKINLLKNYTETRTVNVQVVDEKNHPVQDANVQFMVYNYAELYPVSTNTTDNKGRTSIISGKGDLMIWASKGNRYGYNKSTPQDETTVVKLERKSGVSYSENYVMNVPPEQTVRGLSQEKIAANAARLSIEDSIRNAYMNTFIKENDARQWAQENNLNVDETWKYLNVAQGNWEEIKQFISQKKYHPLLFDFLATLTEKDLRDTQADCLNSYFRDDISENMYIFSPRIELEIIRPQGNFFEQTNIDSASHNIHTLINFVKNQIKIDDEENYFQCRISPQGVYGLRIADRISRNIFFVALCRKFGFPARIEPATGKPQYFEHEWIDVAFDNDESDAQQSLKVRLTVQNDEKNVTLPGYYTHYTLAYFKDGNFHTLDFENNPLVARLPYSLDMDEGYYRLMVGSRANDGSVFVHTEYFELKKDNPHTLTVSLPQVTGKLFVKGIVDMNTIVCLDNGYKTTLKELSQGKGLMLCFLDMGKEPSKHVLQDFPAVKSALETWGGGVLLMTHDDKNHQTLDPATFKGLPQQTAWGKDAQRTLLQTVASVLQIDFQDNFPLTVYLSRNGGILYSSVGYKIGTGEDVWNVIQRE
ncbi:MAG: transglutaminase domain-containing protein [Prevotellaceae bacterium]|jgi:copper homeostasis protein CutC|nr:transglutaminase domain-containing protein [Prevotellaceae bacterium]